MLQLRGYQHELLGDIYGAWETVRTVLAVSPTGSGKTVTFAELIHQHRGAAAVVVHRREIVGQISTTLARLGVKHRIIAPPDTVARIRKRHYKAVGRSFIDPMAPVGVASVQTLTSAASLRSAAVQSWVRQVTRVVFDEGHHYVRSGVWAKAVHLFEHAKVLKITATPERADGKGLGVHSDGFAEVMVEGPTVGWLMSQGYLSRYQWFAPPSDLRTDDIPITAEGDLNMRAMRSRVVESHIVGDVVDHYQRFAPGRRCIVFATDVATAGDICAEFTRRGIAAAALHGGTDPNERERELERFENGTTRVLVNVDLFDEGFDVPEVEAVIMARPTLSLAKFLQMVGRALRPVYAPGYDLETVDGRLAAMAAGPKPAAIVMDPVQNWLQHGMPDWPRRWTLEGAEKRGRATPSDMLPQRACLQCTQPYPAYLKTCPYCGAEHVPPGRSAPEQVAGDLQQLDTDAMSAIFAKYQRANMSDAEYQRDQLVRNIPPVGRARDLHRFQRLKYRRGVLEQLLQWWTGAQQAMGRDMGEIYRRFYLRYRVDMLTALTLDAAQTEALIEAIQLHFDEDIRA